MAVGNREVSDKTVAIRRLGSKQQQFVSLDEAIELLTEEVRLRS
jgi:threonyl-tRNA synthetase